MAAACIAAGCSTPPAFFSQARQYQKTFSQPQGRYTYVLQFDSEARLINFNTLFQAITEIQQSAEPGNAAMGGPVTNILVLSFGWNHDNTVIENKYQGLLSNYDAYIAGCGTNLAAGNPIGPTAVICLSWPATYPTVVQWLADLVPGTDFTRHAMLDVAFPLAFWAKTSLADRVGYGDFQQSMAYLCAQAYQGGSQPGIYLVGHSFGCRALAGAMRARPPSNRFAHTNLSAVANRDIEAFRKCIKGAVLIQPAMAEDNLPDARDCANYPVLVTQSRYDHVNSVLYPITAIPFNGYWSADLDSRFARSVYRNSPTERSAPQPRKWWQSLKPPLYESLRVPFSILDSLELLPASYILGQCWELGRGNWTWRTNYLTSTLAQIPIVQIPVQLTLNTGYHKGIFDVGRWHESSSRLSFSATNILSLESTVNSVSHPTRLDIAPHGVQFVNCDDIISRPSRRSYIDYTDPYWNYTVGQLDPVGSHNDYEPNVGYLTHPQLFDWLHFLLHDSISQAREGPSAAKP